jgi:elongator complex protein 3
LYEGRVDCENVEELFEKMQDAKCKMQDWIITFVIWFQPNISAIRSFVCLDTRSREVRHDESGVIATSWIVIRQYQSSVGTEFFIAYEDALGYLYGFTRLLLPDQGKSVDWEWLGEATALIRELHVYGQVVGINNEKWIINNSDQSQHIWIWRQLMALAEQIATQWWYERLSVISGVGVREYYKKLGYELVRTYMVKGLAD